MPALNTIPPRILPWRGFLQLLVLSGLILQFGVYAQDPQTTSSGDLQSSSKRLPPWNAEGEQKDGGYGHSATGDGDLNGDHFSDVAVTEWKDGGFTAYIHIYFGSALGLSKDRAQVLTLVFTNPIIRLQVEHAGDVNGDGYGDLLAAWETKVTDTKSIPTTIALAWGTKDGVDANWCWKIDRQTVGHSVFAQPIAAGDVNGDRLGDIAIPIRKDGSDGKDHHAILIFHGAKTALSSSPSTILDEERAKSWFGFVLDGHIKRNMSAAGDVNGDGFDDFLVAAPQFSNRFKGRGKVYLYLGSTNGLQSSPSWSYVYDLPFTPARDPDSEQGLGTSISGGIDLNHDGFTDIIAGAPWAANHDLNEGMLFVWLGSRQGPADKPDLVIESNRSQAMFGWAAAGLKDVNGDGYDDVLVGSPYVENGTFQEGMAFLFAGCPNGLRRTPLWTFETDLSNSRLGSTVHNAGDVNGDGFGDWVICEPGFLRNSQDQLGRVWLFYGGSDRIPMNSHASIDKPWLKALQQWMEFKYHFWGMAVYLVPWAPIVIALCIVFLMMQWHLKRRIQLLAAQNQHLILEKERHAIARDVHDNIGSAVNRIAWLLQHPSEKPSRTTVVVNPTSELNLAVKEAAASVREMIWTTQGNGNLESMCLFLMDHARAYFGNAGVQLRFDIPIQLPDWKLPPLVCRHVVAIIKEACCNVLKHSRASEVCLQVSVNEFEWRVALSDNGVGIPKETLNRPRKETEDIARPAPSYRSMGLASMYTRASEISAHLELKSLPDQGTTVLLTRPKTAEIEPQVL